MNDNSVITGLHLTQKAMSLMYSTKQMGYVHGDMAWEQRCMTTSQPGLLVACHSPFLSCSYLFVAYLNKVSNLCNISMQV